VSVLRDAFCGSLRLDPIPRFEEPFRSFSIAVARVMRLEATPKSNLEPPNKENSDCVVFLISAGKHNDHVGRLSVPL
jgi:hypothetical protein